MAAAGACLGGGEQACGQQVAEKLVEFAQRVEPDDLLEARRAGRPKSKGPNAWKNGVVAAMPIYSPM